MQRIARFFEGGLWLAVPVCGGTLLVYLVEFQPLVWIFCIPVIAGLPWNIPGLFAMLASGLGHGGSDVLKASIFFAGVFWTCFSVLLNGAILRVFFRKQEADTHLEINADTEKSSDKERRRWQ